MMESKKIMARISRHHHGLERALRSAPDLDHIVDSDEMVFHPLAAVETGGAGFLDDRLEMAAVQHSRAREQNRG